MYRDGNVQPRFVTARSRLHGALKRGLLLLALLALVLSTLLVPSTSLAYAHGGPTIGVRPADGVGDSPVMP